MKLLEVMGPDRPVYDIEEWLAGYKTSELYLARKQEAEELLVTTDDITCYNDFCVKALEEALEKGKPEIFNTDQGSQFTSEAFTGLLKQRGIQISMDGKGSYRDNLFVERLWRSVKYEEVYLKAYADGRDARAGIGEYLSFYNTQRPHQALGYRTPGEVFISGSGGNVVTSPMTSTSTLGSIRAVHDLNLASYLSS